MNVTANQHIGGRLAGRVGTIRGKRRIFGERARGTQAAVHFVGRDLNEARHVEFPRRIQENLRPQDIRADKRRGIMDASIDVALGREIDNAAQAGFGHLVDGSPIGNVAANEAVARILSQVA